MKIDKIQPLISVIVPAYNHQPYILDALDTIHAQTHERVELIFIDDASDDETFQVASALLETPFGQRFERIELIRKPRNLGAHDSLNLGLELAKGQYVAFLNSDDRFHPRRLEILLAAMAEAGSEFAFSLVNVISEDPPAMSGESDRRASRAKDKPSSADYFFMLFGVTQKAMLLRDPTIGFSLLRQNLATSTGNFVLSQTLAQSVSRFLPMKYCHDWDFLLQCLVWTEPVCVMEYLYDYRLHRGNSFRSLAGKGQIETEATIRRFFRQVSRSETPNPLCPSRRNWGSYFDLFVKEAGYKKYWDAETGKGSTQWRIYERAEERRFGPEPVRRVWN